MDEADGKESSEPIVTRSGPSNINGLLVAIGYFGAVMVGLVGFVYLLNGLNLVLSGGGGDPGTFQDFIGLLVAGSLFSFATFLLVGAYILDRS